MSDENPIARRSPRNAAQDDLENGHAPLRRDAIVIAASAMAEMTGATDVPDVIRILGQALSEVTGRRWREATADVPPGWTSHALGACGEAVHGAMMAEEGDGDGEAPVVGMLCTAAGMAIGCLSLRQSSVHDATARQVAEFEADRLQSSFDRRLLDALAERSLWADVFRGSQYSVCIVSQDLRYLSFNPAFEDWFVRHNDMPPVPGQPIEEALSMEPGIVERAMENWRLALSGEDFTRTWHMTDDTVERHYETRYAPLRGGHGEVTAAVQFSLDVTERVIERRRLEVAEAGLRQSQKMEAVGKLTGGIAHDFNNILTGIVGSLDIIGRKLAAGRTDAVDRYLDIAMKSADRATSLTHRLLAFSRRQPVDPRQTDVDAMLLGMGEMISRTIGPDVTVETSTGGASARVLCDPSQLESAVMNLVVNAREAMPDGGRLMIATSLTDCHGIDAEADGCLQISITDTGIGMTPEVVARAVEPFFTTKQMGQGTGLGLSMVYGFAHQSGGTLDIRSDTGGTTVSIRLPVRATEPAEPTVDQAPVRMRSNACVLVVEDEPAVRTIVVEMLEEMGCRVLQAEDGAKGASILSSDVDLDLLVTDIGLPILNGRQVATAARTSRPDLPILFMTGYSDNATITEGFSGRAMLVTKPFRPGQMAEAVERMLA